jgi:RNA polymerase sigma-70 factor (ECF subfamily)
MAAWKPDPTRDSELVKALAAGDTRALDELDQRHGLAVLSYLIGQVGSRPLAEEVLQDVMLAVWRGAARFRGESSVRTWMLAIARKRAISARLAHQRREDRQTPLEDNVPTGDAGPLDVLEQRATVAEVRAALSHLPADQRETLELIFYHELSGPEAAKVLGIAPGTVKSRLNRAKTMLRRVLRLQEDLTDA